MTKLNDFAPYPEREDDATADALARSYAVIGHANHRRMFDAPDADERHDAVATVVHAYGITYLLREFAKVDKDRADAAARDLWSAWDAGDSLGEWLWEWLANDYGIDMEAVNQVVERMCAEPLAKSARAALAEAEADRDRAREIAVALEQENARLAGEVATWRKATDDSGLAIQKINRERGAAQDRANAAEAKLHQVAMAKVWTNEDGKKFVFVDDLYAALESGGRS